MGLIITLILGIGVMGVFALSEFKNWLERYDDTEDRK